MPPEIEAVDAQKHRRGLSRIWHAYGYSVAGLVTGFRESAAFRQEVLLCLLLVLLLVLMLWHCHKAVLNHKQILVLLLLFLLVLVLVAVMMRGSRH